jgi:hypothetical protein
MNRGHVSLTRAKRITGIPIEIADVIDRLQHTPWALRGLFRDYLQQARLTYEHFERIRKALPDVAKDVENGLVPKELVKESKDSKPTLSKLYELVKEAEPIREIDTARLTTIQSSKLWQEPKPLADIVNLEHAKYATPRIAEELRVREKDVLPDWNKIQGELEKAALTETKTIALKTEVDAFTEQAVYVLPGSWADCKKERLQFRLIRGERFYYYSPELINQAHVRTQEFIPISELRKNKQFLEDIAFLDKHLKPEYAIYSSDDKVIVVPWYDAKRVQKMLGDDALVDKAIVGNAARIRNDLPFYEAAYHRRQAFAAELQKRTGGDKDYNLVSWKKREISEELRKQFLGKIYERVRSYRVLCKLINGQAAGDVWYRRAGSPRFTSKLTRDYWNKQLDRKTLDRWVLSHRAEFEFEYALAGQSPHCRIVDGARHRLDLHYKESAEKKLGIIKDSEYKSYGKALDDLQKAIDTELLQCSRTAPAQAR